jgi:hypothetical protein
VVSCGGNPVGSSTVDYLVVAGGGGGAGGSSATGGSNSVFSTITSSGGGAGGDATTGKMSSWRFLVEVVVQKVIMISVVQSRWNR